MPRFGGGRTRHAAPGGAATLAAAERMWPLRLAPAAETEEQRLRQASAECQRASKGRWFPSDEFSTSIRVQPQARVQLDRLPGQAAASHAAIGDPIAYACEHRGCHVHAALSGPLLRAFAGRLLLLAVAGFGRPVAGRGMRRARPQSQQPAAQPQQPDQAAPDAGGPAGTPGSSPSPKRREPRRDALRRLPPEPKFKTPRARPTSACASKFPRSPSTWACCWRKPTSLCPASSPRTSASTRTAWSRRSKASSAPRRRSPLCMLCEFAARGMAFRIDMLNAAWAFTQQLRPRTTWP